MDRMFFLAESFDANANPIYDWDVSNVTNMEDIFVPDDHFNPEHYFKVLYLKTVNIETYLSRMSPKQRDLTRLAIATALKKKQQGRDTTLNNDLMKNIMEYGGKKKSNTKTRKYLIKKSKTKTRKYLIKKSKTKTRKTRKRS